MNMRRAWQFNFMSLCLLLLLALMSSRALASGVDYSRRARNLTVDVDYRWAGGGHGGYLPVRIRVRNIGKERELLFQYGNLDNVPNSNVVQRRITIGQNATRQFTLSIPIVTGMEYGGSYGRLTVRENGRVIGQLSGDISLPEAGWNKINCPSLLVISSSQVDCQQFSEAANAVSKGPTSTYGARGWGGGSSFSKSQDFEVINPLMLPTDAVDYAGLDVLAVSLKTFAQLPEASRSAILAWTRMGGKLIVYETGKPVEESEELTRLLGLDDLKGWQAADVSSHKEVKPVDEDTLTTDPSETSVFSGIVTNQTEEEKQQETDAITGRGFIPKPTADAFAIHEFMLGHVIAFSGNPFPGTIHEWAWVLNSLKPDSWRWTDRNGVSSRQADDLFSQFLIPGVGGVPKIAFIVLITGFTIVIGPLNYFLLKRRRQLYLLVVTIPAIAFLTSCSLFAYAAVADGFGVKSRVRSFTLLDQRSKVAVSQSRVALYAGVAPSDGLKFSRETAVFPLWGVGQDIPNGRLDWTGGQNFTSGWLRSRTPAQFLINSHRTERGRLEITPESGGVNVANGLAWKIDTLVVADESGTLYQGAGLPAGASMLLSDTEPQDVAKLLKEIFIEHPFDLYSTAAPPSRTPTPFSVMRGGSDLYTDLSFSNSLLEEELKRLMNAKTPAFPPRSYVAVLSENPGIELGIESTEPKGDFHVLLGRY